MDQLEKFMNNLTDTDWTWWPFLYLRPEKDERITWGRLLKISVYNGSFYGLFFTIIYIRTHANYMIPLYVTMSFIVFLFVVYKLTFVYFWNRRADSYNH